MRYAFISDIHSNLQALDAVLEDIRKQDIEYLICLGDIIGYGPSPNEVIEKLQNLASECILGNHDAAVAGYINTENFNETARISIEWTKSVIKKEYIKFLAKQPLEIRFENMRFAHSGFHKSATFSYLIEQEDALKSFLACKEQLLFSGHTHIPGLFVIGQHGIPHWLPPVNFGIEKEKRYLINAGSVGLPRDNDPRASYCIYDSEKGDIFFRKVEFDLMQYKKELLKQNLPIDLDFLNYMNFQKSNLPDQAFPKPESHDEFVPLNENDTEKLYARMDDLNKQITSMKKLQKNFIFFISIFIIMFFIMLGAFYYLSFQYGSGDKKIIQAEYESLPVLEKFNTKKFNYLPPFKGNGLLSGKTPQDYYSFSFNDASQKIIIVKTEDSKHKTFPTLKVYSENSLKQIIITSSIFKTKNKSRYKISCQLKLINSERCICRIALEYKGKNGNWHPVMEKADVKTKITKRWYTVSSTMLKKQILDSNSLLRYVVKLNFKGNILIRKCYLKKK